MLPPAPAVPRREPAHRPKAKIPNSKPARLNGPLNRADRPGRPHNPCPPAAASPILSDRPAHSAQAIPRPVQRPVTGPTRPAPPAVPRREPTRRLGTKIPRPKPTRRPEAKIPRPKPATPAPPPERRNDRFLSTPSPSETRIILITLIILLALSAASCRNSAPMVRVLAGNMAHGRGQYQRAILHYLAAEKHPGSAADTVHYNLGNIYYALGEGEAALRSWARAENSTENVETLFRVAFNRGVLYYQWGRFEESYRSFRRALVLKPSDMDTKINLEDSLSRIRTELTAPGDTASSPLRGDEGARRLLDYVRRKEAVDWSRPSITTDETDSDW